MRVAVQQVVGASRVGCAYLFTKAYYEKLPEWLRSHLTCRVVDELEPIEQAHTIEGLKMGAT